MHHTYGADVTTLRDPGVFKGLSLRLTGWFNREWDQGDRGIITGLEYEMKYFRKLKTSRDRHVDFNILVTILLIGKYNYLRTSTLNKNGEGCAPPH